MTPQTVRVLIGVIAAAAGIALLPGAFYPLAQGEPSLWGRLLMVGIGWAFIGAGLAAWGMRREHRTGKVMIGLGFAFWATPLIGLRIPLLWTLGSTLSTLFIPFLYYLVLSFPDGRLHRRSERLIVVWAVLNFLVGSVVFAPFYDPATFGCADCPQGLNLLLISDRPDLVPHGSRISGFMQLFGLMALGATLVRRWASATKPRRAVLWPMLIPTLGYIAATFTYIAFQRLSEVRIYDAPVPAYKVTVLTVLFSLLLMPLTFLVGLARVTTKRARIGQLVVELGDLPSSEQLRRALARALGDDSLEVGIWVSEANRYLSPEGRTVDPDEPGAHRMSTFLERHGQRLGVLIHDRALMDDPGLVAAVTAATRLTVENDRLQEEILEQLAEVHASRARLVEAADAERRRIERNLHDGAQQRLVSLSLALRMTQARLNGAGDEGVRSSLEDAAVELEEALGELRELARGTYPAVLTEGGLAAAVDALADRSSVPVSCDLIAVEGLRWPERMEATAYFVVAEALTNVARYSAADHVTVRLSIQGGDLLIEVTDDGRGGADIRAGRGLRGLADRVHALDGTFSLRSPRGHGTELLVRLPVEERAPTDV
jgi:signal transduction histidine kinase